MIRATVGLTLILIAGSKAYAQPGFYVGIGIGQSTVEVEGTNGFDATDTGYKLFTGYNFENGLLPWGMNLSVEGGFVDLGEPDELILGQTVAFGLDGIVIYAVASRPFGERWSLAAKLGVIDYDSETTLDGSALFSDSDTELAMGGSAEMRLTEALNVRFDLEGFRVLDETTSLLSVSLLYRF